MGRQKDSRKIGKGDKKAESQRVIEKEEITSTEFPKGGDTIHTKRMLMKSSMLREQNTDNSFVRCKQEMHYFFPSKAKILTPRQD